MGERSLKVSYGTTKYCSHFIRNEECPNLKECLFLHKEDISNQIVVSEEHSKAMYAEQLKHALEVVSMHAEQLC